MALTREGTARVFERMLASTEERTPNGMLSPSLCPAKNHTGHRGVSDRPVKGAGPQRPEKAGLVLDGGSAGSGYVQGIR